MSRQKNQPDEGACNLESILATDELEQRAARGADPVAEGRALLGLVQDLSESPQDFFQKLVNVALELSVADSTGISLLAEDKRSFFWPAVAGGLSPYIHGGTPRDFGPCGTVLDRNASLLFKHPERHFTYLAPITPSLEEVLLIPFYMNQKAVGTIWAVIHQKGCKFDREDKRLLESLSAFAASAYCVLSATGALKSIFEKKPASGAVERGV